PSRVRQIPRRAVGRMHDPKIANSRNVRPRTDDLVIRMWRDNHHSFSPIHLSRMAKQSSVLGAVQYNPFRHPRGNAHPRTLGPPASCLTPRLGIPDHVADPLRVLEWR